MNFSTYVYFAVICVLCVNTLGDSTKKPDKIQQNEERKETKLESKEPKGLHTGIKQNEGDLHQNLRANLAKKVMMKPTNENHPPTRKRLKQGIKKQDMPHGILPIG